MNSKMRRAKINRSKIQNLVECQVDYYVYVRVFERKSAYEHSLESIFEFSSSRMRHKKKNSLNDTKNYYQSSLFIVSIVLVCVHAFESIISYYLTFTQ